MRAYKFLTDAGRGVFSGFAWPLPDDGLGEWVESEVEPCRAGIHACRPRDLPYWLAHSLYEIELDGPLEEQETKVVAPRGRLMRRITAWDGATRNAYGQMCLARAHELVAAAPVRLASWAPPPEIALESARVGYVAARIAEELDGVQAYFDERRRQAEWLVDRLSLV